MWFSLVTDQTGATSSSSGFGSSITNPDCEKGDMAVVKKLIKDVWLHGQGSTFTAKICRCPTDGRLQEFNVSLKQWSPLTDSDRLVSDVSKLLGMIDMGEGAEKPCKAYTPEQRGSVENCSDAVDVHHIHYDPQVAKQLSAHLAQCLPDLKQQTNQLGSQKPPKAARG